MQERLNQIERYLLCLAVFLSPMRELRPTEINFTIVTSSSPFWAA
jgi:hypothetical protein